MSESQFQKVNAECIALREEVDALRKAEPVQSVVAKLKTQMATPEPLLQPDTNDWTKPIEPPPCCTVS